MSTMVSLSKGLSCWSLRSVVRGEARGSLKNGLREGVVSGVVDFIVSEIREMQEGC